MEFCILCHVPVTNSDIHYVVGDLGYEMLAIIDDYNAEDNDVLCSACFDEAVLSLQQRDARQQRNSCVWCGIFIRDRHTHRVLECRISNHIRNRIAPRQVSPDSRVCYPCWLAARRAVLNEEVANVEQLHDIAEPADIDPDFIDPDYIDPDNIDPDYINEEQHANHQAPAATILLPNYKRCSNSEAHCFVDGCPRIERFRLTDHFKQHLIINYKFYTGANARVCSDHKILYDWEDILNEGNYSNIFSNIEIEDMLSLASKQMKMIDFEDFNNMDNTVCRFWTGLTKENFEIIANIPEVQASCRKCKTYLAIYLIKIRTAMPNLRIADLFNLSEKQIGNIIHTIRETLLNSFVPQHLGLHTMSRDDLLSRNLTIPEGLFGNQNEPVAIVICDATYLYIQKSSNYSFQKNTYSLHKYRNLIKPFLIVTTDGRIVDAYGPYKDNDAKIMKDLFLDENGPLRNYFQPGDVFILDRGFRDVVQFLTELNYKVYLPETLDPSETQLSTLKANKSRLVTLCRWVVEVCNGRFKRDFKIFRSEFFNINTTHAMEDFRIAAALLNCFHVPITNRPDAPLILDRALQRLYVNNYLGEFIIENNFNRRRAEFITVEDARDAKCIKKQNKHFDVL